MKRSAWLIVATAAIVGCTTGREATKGEPTTVTQAETQKPPCPLGVMGAHVTAEDTPDGVVLSFTTDGDPTELRQRVFDASAMYGPGARMGKGHEGTHGEGGQHGLLAMQLPPLSAASAEIPQGARIRFVPANAADLETMRTKLRARALDMNTTACK